MPPANRHQPRRAKSSTSDYSVTEFLAEFPDDAACLEHLWRTRHAPDGEHAHCPKCDAVKVFKRYATKQQPQTCTACGRHLHPTAGTIFHRSSTFATPVVPRHVPDDEHSPRGNGNCAGNDRTRRARSRPGDPVRRGKPLSDVVRVNVNPEAILYTDDWMSDRPLAREFADHRVINHSAGTGQRSMFHALVKEARNQ